MTLGVLLQENAPKVSKERLVSCLRKGWEKKEYDVITDVTFDDGDKDLGRVDLLIGRQDYDGVELAKIGKVILDLDSYWRPNLETVGFHEEDYHDPHFQSFVTLARVFGDAVDFDVYGYAYGDLYRCPVNLDREPCNLRHDVHLRSGDDTILTVPSRVDRVERKNPVHYDHAASF